jgi:hypothetical protein
VYLRRRNIKVIGRVSSHFGKKNAILLASKSIGDFLLSNIGQILVFTVIFQ